MEVAGLLGVSTRFANEAMRHLAARHVLSRKPKAGTIIGPGLNNADGTDAALPFDVVHFLIRQDYYFSERRRMEALVTGITSALPGCALQLNFVPAFNEVPYVERLLENIPSSRNGFLVAVKSPQLQRLFEKQPAPSVLLGTPFQGITHLAWIDKNQSAIGHLLAGKLIEQGHRRIGVILRDRRGCGDDLMMDAITEEILNAGLGSGGLVVRSVPAEAPLINMAMSALLSPQNRPSALICRNRAIFQSALQTCHTLNLQIPNDLTLAIADPPADGEEMTPVPCLRPRSEIDAVEEGRRLAETLIALSRRESPANLHQLIQVRL